MDLFEHRKEINVLHVHAHVHVMVQMSLHLSPDVLLATECSWVPRPLANKSCGSRALGWGCYVLRRAANPPTANPPTAIPPAANPPLPMEHSQPTGSQYTGVDESAAGRKPGIKKTRVLLSYGVYETLPVKLTVQYHGHDDETECAEAFKVNITLPEKWLDNPTPASALKAHFLKAYRKKHPQAELSREEDEDVNLAIKDESLFCFSRELLADQAIITAVLYDRQDVWVMGPADWDAMEARLASMRKLVVDALQHTLRSVRHRPEQTVPVTHKRQLVPGNCYVLLVGWYKQQCVIVTPEFTVADLKAYLHHKNGARMPMESLDIGFRKGEDVIILDDGWTLNAVYEHYFPLDHVTETKPVPEPEVEPAGGATVEAAEGEQASEAAEEELESVVAGGGTTVSAPAAQAAMVHVPSFFGKTLVLGVGKRIQDRKHQIWLPSVHDPYSFHSPEDEMPQGGASALPALHAPKGWCGDAEPTVGQDENCSIQ